MNKLYPNISRKKKDEEDEEISETRKEIAVKKIREIERSKIKEKKSEKEKFSYYRNDSLSHQMNHHLRESVKHLGYLIKLAETEARINKGFASSQGIKIPEEVTNNFKDLAESLKDIIPAYIRLSNVSKKGLKSYRPDMMKKGE